MSDHAYGHGQYCYWCDADADTKNDRECDDRLHKKPTEAQHRHYDCVEAIQDAKHELEQAERICEKRGYLDAAKDVYDCRLRLSEALRSLEELRPKREDG